MQRDHLLDAFARILDAEPEPGESVQRSFDRKERDLRAYCDELDHESRSRLWSRLVAAEANDPMVAKLGRLTSERRQRMLASLAETPRRRTR